MEILKVSVSCEIRRLEMSFVDILELHDICDFKEGFKSICIYGHGLRFGIEIDLRFARR